MGKKLDLQQVHFTSFLASGVSFFGRDVAKGATKSREVVPRHIKSDEGLFWKSWAYSCTPPYVLKVLNEKKGLRKSILNPFQLHNSA